MTVPPSCFAAPPVVEAICAVAAAAVAGVARGEGFGDLVSRGERGEMAAQGGPAAAAGLAIGLAAGAMGLRGARPTIDSDPGDPRLGRATRTMVAAALCGVTAAPAVLGLREGAGRWSTILPVVVLPIAAATRALVAIVPASRGREDEAGVAGDEPIDGVH